MATLLPAAREAIAQNRPVVKIEDWIGGRVSLVLHALLQTALDASPPLPSRLSPLSAQTQFLHEERICLPIGALVGAITAVLNDRWSAAGSAAAGGRSDKGHERSGGGAAGAGGLGAFGDPLGGSSSSSSGGSAASHGGGIGAGGGSSGGGIGIPIDTGGPNDPNAFASSDADAIEDAFDPFPTNAKTKY